MGGIDGNEVRALRHIFIGGGFKGGKRERKCVKKADDSIRV